ncbi:MAG: hypothetical protein B7Z35_00200 [Hydrogenophilales bacterium 12-61-10]|nr:MAG: hypothetical protein B7Z35_00200 [Hydrogenophilales bacterium 12-61-10]OYX30254.1 MAG: hypothetical protein B7Z03_06620 [Hydrogenophilales bacterium 32-62-9]
MGEPESERAIVARYRKFPGGHRRAAAAATGLEQGARILQGAPEQPRFLLVSLVLTGWILAAG